MCGRFTLKSSPQQVATLFADLPVAIPEFVPRYNIAPTQQVLAVREASNGGAAVWLRWGLIPFWAKDTAIGARMINARLDTVDQKPAFRAAFKSRRCLVVADGFYEWRAMGKRKQPFYITAAEGALFAFAGIWESWRDPTKPEPLESCSILTTDASDDLRSLHDRMPCVVPPQNFAAWLDADFAHPKSLLAGAGGASAVAWDFVPVNPVVNNARHDAPDCIQQVP